MPVGALSGMSLCFSISGRDQVLAAGRPASPVAPSPALSAHPVVRRGHLGRTFTWRGHQLGSFETPAAGRTQPSLQWKARGRQQKRGAAHIFPRGVKGPPRDGSKE